VVIPGFRTRSHGEIGPSHAGSEPVSSVTDAYAACERIARQHYENFPVASRLLPAPMRPHIAAIYAFARAADDFADEGDLARSERLALLDDWGNRLKASAGMNPAVLDPGFRQGDARIPSPESRIPSPESRIPSPESRIPSPESDAIFLALGETLRAHALPVSLFEDLLRAFRQDVTTKRYDTWTDVMAYCRNSANPVGRLVLRVAGRVDPRLDRASDAVCTALQLTNFWQDLERDWQKGRLYVPRDVCDRFGALERDLDARILTPAWRNVLSDVAARTRALFDEGRAVCDGVDGRLRYELRFTWLGGRRILDRLEQAEFDVFTSRPALAAPDVPGLLWGAFAWRPSKPA
jgi:squalene synthase HpnC